MKKKYIGLVLGISLSTSLLAGCSGSESKSSSDAGQTLYGQVTEITDDSITIDVGTQKEMEKPDSEDNSAASDSTTDTDENQQSDNSKESKEKPSMLDLTGEEKEIKLEDDTVIKRQSMGAPNGVGPQGAAQNSDGDGSGEDSQPSQDPNETAPPEKPDGSDAEQSDSSETEQPDGNVPSKPDGEMNEASEEEISVNDISKGDTVTITFDDDGNAEEILVISMGGPGQSDAVDSYDDKGDTADASKTSSWSDYETDKPSQLS